MGQYRFNVPSSKLFDESAFAHAQIVGLDGVPWPCKSQWQDGELVIIRNTDFSGRLLIPILTPFGRLAITSGTIPESDEPYCIILELARGNLSRLRNQVSLWQEGGLQIPEEFENELDSITRLFSQSVFLRGEEQLSQRVSQCEQILEKSMDLMFVITREFATQVDRLRRDQQLPVLVSVGSIGPTPSGPDQDIQPPEGAPDLNVIEHQTVPETRMDGDNLEIDFAPVDERVQSLMAHPSMSIVGPLVDFSQDAMPPWMDAEWPFEKRIQVASALCRKFGERYAGRIQLVHVAAGLNGIGQQHFNYPQQLQLTLEMIESLDHHMTNASLMVSFDQPWGERLAMASGATQAIEIADSLLRYGARVSVMGLDLNLDYFPHGSIVRDPFQWVDLVDRWAQFGLPLIVNLCAPHGDATREESRHAKTIQHSLDESQLIEYLETVIRMLIARPSIHAVIWRQFSDESNLRFPSAGLVDTNGGLKAVASWLAPFIQQFEACKGSNKTVIRNTP